MRKIKKIIGILLSLAMLCQLFYGLPVSAAANQQNVLFTEDFESAEVGTFVPSGWTAMNPTNTNIEIVEDSVSGKVLKLSGIAANGGVTKNITGDFRSGGKMQITAKLRGTLTAGKAFIIVIFYKDNGNGGYTFNGQEDGIFSTVQNDWNSVGYKYTIPNDTTLIQVQVRMAGPTANGEIYWDNIKADMINTTDVIKNGAFEYIDTTGIGFYNWTTSGNAEIIESNKESRPGKYLVRLTGASQLAQAIKGLVPGATYKVNAWVKSVGTSQPIFTFDWYDGLDFKTAKCVKSEFLPNPSRSEPTEWSPVTYEFTAPDTAVGAVFAVRNRAQTGEVYFDDVTVIGEVSESFDRSFNPPAPVERDSSVASGVQGEIVRNGGFENLFESGKAREWTPASLGVVAVDKDNVHTGSNSIKLDTTNIVSDTKRTHIQQSAYFVAGTKYEFSFYAKAETANLQAAMKIEFAGAEVSRNYPNISTTDWQKCSISFIAPESGSASILVRHMNTEGVIYIDDVSIIGEKYKFGSGNGEKIPANPTPPTPIPGKDNMINNGDFEELNAAGDGPMGWAPYGAPINDPDWGKREKEVIELSTDKPLNGKYSIKIDNTGEINKMPWVRILVHDIVPTAKYQMLMWTNTSEVYAANGAGYKIEWYVGDTFPSGSPGGDVINRGFGNTGDDWKQLSETVTAPDGARMAAIYVRLYSPGIAYFDDISFYQISEPAGMPIKLMTDNVFYYTDHKTGVANVSRLDRNIELRELKFSEDSKISFRLMDGEAVLKSSDVPFNSVGIASFEYDLGLLAVEKKEYTIESSISDLDGNIYEDSQKIYKYKRPTAIREDGMYVLDDGTILDPVFGYHAGDILNDKGKYFDYCKQIGVNVVQTKAVMDVPSMVKQLDMLRDNGLMGLVCLYPGMKSAGHPERIQLTKDMVTAIKDHPAVFAYALLDEPAMNIFPDSRRDEELRNAYIAIRDIDTHHPTYICDFMKYEEVSRYCDVFIIDDYYEMNEYGMNVDIVNNAHEFKKPVYTLLEAYLPSSTIEEVRYTMYDSLFEGSLGSGYYAIEDLFGNFYTGTPIQPLQDELVTLNQSGELRDAFKHFVHGEFLYFNEYKDDTVSWSAYIKDGAVNLVLLNKVNSNTIIEIPLTSSDGTVSLGNSTIEVIHAGTNTNKDNFSSEGNIAKIPMKAYEAKVFKITPEGTVDFSNLRAKSKFIDLDVQWAKEAIEVLESKGIVNNGTSPRAYSPNKNITEADFAMFLIRTLGLTSDSTVYPNSEISRQNAMAMVEKAMKLKDPNFDIYSLSELVTGNAEDHITRAVAAVTMYQLMNTENVPGPEQNKVLVSITTPAAITGVVNGTAKNAGALGLPSTVKLEIKATTEGSIEVIEADVTWNVANSSYNPDSKDAQTFTVTGTVTLPEGVVNPDEIPQTVSIEVIVKATETPTTPETPTPTLAPAPVYETKVEEGQVTTTISVKTTTDANGRAVAAISGTQLADAIVKAAAEAATQGTKTQTTVRIEVSTTADAKTAGVNLTTEALTKFIDSKADTLAISTPFGTMTFDEKTAAGILKQSVGTVTITAAKVEAVELTTEIRQKVGDRPVVSFDITDRDKTISQLGGNATVTIPYVLKAGENPNALVVYYINEAGKLKAVTNGKYDPTTGTITFKTPHFSKYAVGYNKVGFADVADSAWYGNAVTFAAARGITVGVGNGNFGSDEVVTRAQALVMIMKAFGINPDENAENNFSDAGNTYYTGYLAAAKSLGITSGVGGNLFAPDRQITRQEMFVFVYNTLKSIDELPSGATAKSMADFKDAEKVADYANKAVELFVKTGIISGSSGNILPADSASRAQFVQILYNALIQR